MLPRLTVILSALFLGWIMVAGAGAAGLEPVGMILSIEGDVTLEHASQISPPSLADLLFAGDRIVSGSGRAALIYCPGKEILTTQRDSTTVIGSAEIETLSGDPPDSKKSSRCALPHVALGAESLEHVGALRLRSTLPPIPLYLGGRVSEERPTFRWAAIKNATSYRLRVSDLKGKTLWDHRTDGITARYPESKKPLGKGDYLWRLTAWGKTEIAGPQLAVFRIEPASMAISQPADNDSERLLRAVELENAGYYSEAAHELVALLSGRSSDDRILRRIVWLYWNAGLTTAAEDIMAQMNSEK